jgi:phenylacetate-CoA ligase
MLVTPLYNYVMPLIRYDHADFARVASSRCQITLPAFQEIFGKMRVPFVFPGGREIQPYVPTGWVVDCLGAQIFQVAQVAPDRCEFRIVAGSLAPAQMRFDELTNRMRSLWWEGLQIEYRIVDALPRRSAQSKHQLFVQEMPGVTGATTTAPAAR